VKEEAGPGEQFSSHVMNYAKPVNERFAQSLLGRLPSPKRNWTIPFSAIMPIAVTGDVLIIFITSIAACASYNLYTFGGPGNLVQFGALASIVSALFIALGKSTSLYKASHLLTLRSQIPRVTINLIGIFLFLSGVAFAMRMGASFSRGATIAFAISALVGLIGTRVIWRLLLVDGSAVRQFSGRRVVLISEESAALDSFLFAPFALQGLQLASHFVLPVNRNDVRGCEQVIGEVVASVRGSNIEEVIVAANLDRWPQLSKLLSSLKVLPCPVTLVPIGPISDLFRLPIQTIGPAVTIELQRRPLTLLDRLLKRTIDIVISGTAIVLFLPLLLMTAIAVKIDSPGPVIFKQRRCGFNGRHFQILKFRTMSVLEDGERIDSAKHNDIRVTRIGSWLRRTSIDELLQLFNVLQGDMSIVGPRPHALAHDNQFDKSVAKYAYRHHVKPGITGWAQVNGHRGSMATVIDVEQRVKFDLWYIDNWSLALDIKIILMTAVEIVRGENAY
jgi:Undecaprenyl-phosphate glucose phosphotransferase